MVFHIALAGKTIQIQSIHDQVYHLCKDYLVDPMQKEVDLEVVVSQYDIEKEYKIANIKRGSTYLSDSYMETLVVYRKIATAMLDYNTWLMHGAVLGIGETAYMVTAVSGTGKTTFISLALKHFENAFVINGDKPLLQLEEESVWVYGTPWAGKEHMQKNCRKPLKAIFILERGEDNRLQEIEFKKAFPVILQQSYKPKESDKMNKTLDLLTMMANLDIKFYRLSFKHYEDIEDLENEEVIQLLDEAII